MERESFEKESIAAILNAHFISIKVDREERPDVDRIYMNYVQAATGSGGWPMSVWLTPDLHPFVGGTYFPPESRYGRPGFPDVLLRIAEAWRTERDRITGQSARILQQLQETSSTKESGEIQPESLALGFQTFHRIFDSRYGGFGQAPKFPRPAIYHFLLRYALREQNQEALEMVLTTLRAMSKGGMNDQLGGGFHRYSVDGYWFVPHFEKMLYDQAQLASSYLEAFQITDDETFAQEVRRILDYVLREMTHPEGGFYSAEDADSVIDPEHPEEKGEGAFYIWSAAEIEKIIGSEKSPYFHYRYGVEPGGNVENDPQNEFKGRNILFEAHTLEATAQHFDRPVSEIQDALRTAAELLLKERGKRPKPHLDDKVLTAWNGMMISAFARAGAALREPRYTEAAIRAAAFVENRLMPEGQLLRRFREGSVAIPAFLDDYAAWIQALLDLFETTFGERYLRLAMEMTRKQKELFADEANGGFFNTAIGDSSLVMRMKDDYDGAEPSANSVAAMNLLRLGRMTSDDALIAEATKTLHAFAQRINESPFAVPQMLSAWALLLTPPKQIVVAGDPGLAETQQLLGNIYSRFLPDTSILPITDLLPSTAAMKSAGERPAVFVCENFTCHLPAHSVEELRELLQ